MKESNIGRKFFFREGSLVTIGTNRRGTVEIIESLMCYVATLDGIAKDIAAVLTEKLISKGSFTKLSEIDNLIPDDSGIYCVRLSEGAKLPENYQKELDKRESQLIYIGKAENKSLHVRFLKQELRARGHGTFFRSVGAMLGFTPPKGSLKDKKNKKNYKFSKADEIEIINWMNDNLEASWAAFDGPFIIEKYLTERHRPLLNINDNPQPFDLLVKDRAKCRRNAKGESGR